MTGKRDIRSALGVVFSAAVVVAFYHLYRDATQAAAALNLYTEISGVEYPFGELNLVNDPATGMLYGQAPSSMVYLGTNVFRGAASQGDAGRSRFLKSLVAHEVGHQWWGSRVSNSNQRNYWFVETLAEYISALYLEAVFGPKEYEEQVAEWRRTILSRDAKGNVQASYQLYPGDDGFGFFPLRVPG